MRYQKTQENDDTINAVNLIIYRQISILYGTFDRTDPMNSIEYEGNPSNEQFLAIIENQQKRIITSSLYRDDILFKLDYKNLDKWYQILKPGQNILLEPAAKYGVSFPYRYFAVKSVILPKKLPFEDIILFLDLHFGQNIFPDYTFEDAAVILFIKPVFSKINKYPEKYQEEIRRYINYMSFALKKVIEEIQELKIPLFPDETDIITLPACQYILLYLNENYK